MNDNNLLNQAEIDALLNSASDVEFVEAAETVVSKASQGLSPEEIDALGEIGNISMGSASTTLSGLLGRKVNITSPSIAVLTQEKLFDKFDTPFIIIEVDYIAGLNGSNVLIMHLPDAMRMADLMMGGDGSQVSEEVTEMELSAASEAMNQMIGTASTSMATIFDRMINISPPRINLLQRGESKSFRISEDDPVVVVSFKMTITDLLDTEIMQVLGLDTAREEASLLLQQLYDMYSEDNVAGIEELPPVEAAVFDEPTRHDQTVKSAQQDLWGTMEMPSGGNLTSSVVQVDQAKLAMLMDIPLKVSVILGRTRRPIKDVLSFTPGAIVELSTVIDEPVEVLVNGTLVAKGEVVVINENFGVRIIEIISPGERLQKVMA